MTNELRLLTVARAAAELGVAPVTIRAWVARRRIGAVRLGRRGRAIRIPQHEVTRLIEQGYTPALAEYAR